MSLRLKPREVPKFSTILGRWVYPKQQRVKVDGVEIHHDKWWSFAQARAYDGLFKDALGDRRNGDGTLRKHVGFHEI